MFVKRNFKIFPKLRFLISGIALVSRVYLKNAFDRKGPDSLQQMAAAYGHCILDDATVHCGTPRRSALIKSRAAIVAIR